MYILKYGGPVTKLLCVMPINSDTNLRLRDFIVNQSRQAENVIETSEIVLIPKHYN